MWNYIDQVIKIPTVNTARWFEPIVIRKCRSRNLVIDDLIFYNVVKHYSLSVSYPVDKVKTPLTADDEISNKYVRIDIKILSINQRCVLSEGEPNWLAFTFFVASNFPLSTKVLDLSTILHHNVRYENKCSKSRQHTGTIHHIRNLQCRTIVRRMNHEPYIAFNVQSSALLSHRINKRLSPPLLYLSTTSL